MHAVLLPHFNDVHSGLLVVVVCWHGCVQPQLLDVAFWPYAWDDSTCRVSLEPSFSIGFLIDADVHVAHIRPVFCVSCPYGLFEFVVFVWSSTFVSIGSKVDRIPCLLWRFASLISMRLSMVLGQVIVLHGDVLVPMVTR